MDSNILVAAISSGGSIAIAVTALILSYRGFASIDSRFASIDSRFASLESRFSSIDARFASMDARFASIEQRLDSIQQDLRDFYKILAQHDADLSAIKTKLGM